MFGKHICDLAPTPENRRNSEGCFLTMKDGRILFVYTRYNEQGHQDGCNADLYAIISEDNGETFGDPFPFFERSRIGADNVMSVTLRWMDNGDRVIRLRSGRWLAAGAIHSATELIDTPDGKRKITEGLTSGQLQIYVSDDDGFTWKTIVKGISIPTDKYRTTGVQEPGVIQLEDGRIWCFIRTDYGRQYETFSSDDGATWSEPEASWFTSPDSPLSMKRLQDGRLFAVWNPIPRGNIRPWRIDGAMTGSRTPLVCAVSRDEGQSWESITTIESDDRRGFCYIAIHELPDGSVLLGYCAGSPEDKCCLSRLRIRKLYKEDLATL